MPDCDWTQADASEWIAKPCQDRSCWHVADCRGGLLFAVPSKELAERIVIGENYRLAQERRPNWGILHFTDNGWTLTRYDVDAALSFPTLLAAMKEFERLDRLESSRS